MINKKKQASGSVGYVFLFLVVMLIMIITMYLMQVAKLMTHQHHVDDALCDSVLASLVADDVYYFETYETTGTPVVRLDDVDESYDIFVDCMMDVVGNTEDFYYNFSIDKFICYEVSGSTIKVTTYSGSSGTKTVSTGRVGSLRSPTGELVTKTSAYKVASFHKVW